MSIVNIKKRVSVYSYVILDIGLKVISYISIPVFAKLMSTEEYGQYYLLISYMEIAAIVFALNSWSGIVLFKNKEDFLHENSIYGIIFLSYSLVIGITLILNVFLDINFSYFYFILALSFFQSLINVLLEVYRASSNVKLYSFVMISFALLSLGLGISMVYYLHGNKYVIRSISYLISLIITSVVFISKTQWKKESFFDLSKMKKYLMFSIPLIPFALSSSILAYFDRIIIDLYCTKSDVGIYSFSYNIALIISVLALGLNKSLQPKFFKLMGEEKHDAIRALINKYTYSFLLAMSLFSFFFPIALKVFNVGGFYSSKDTIFIIIASYTLVFYYAVFANYIYYNGNTKTVSLVTMISAAINLLLNIIFVPVYGYFVAAITTYVSYLILVLLVCFIKRKLYKGIKGSKVTGVSFVVAHIIILIAWGWSNAVDKVLG